MNARSVIGLIVIGAITAVAPIAGALWGKPDGWYRAKNKPKWMPPQWSLAPIWAGLYTGSALSAWMVWKSPPSPARSRAMQFWLGQHALNAAWSPLFFGAHSPKAAFVDALGMIELTKRYSAEAVMVSPTAAALMTPYALWIAFTSKLNAGFIAKNA